MGVALCEKVTTVQIIPFEKYRRKCAFLKPSPIISTNPRPCPSWPRHWWSFLSTFSFLRLSMTASWFEILLVNLDSGMSVYNLSARPPPWSLCLALSCFFFSFFSLLDSFLVNVFPVFSWINKTKINPPKKKNYTFYVFNFSQ